MTTRRTLGPFCSNTLDEFALYIVEYAAMLREIDAVKSQATAERICSWRRFAFATAPGCLRSLTRMLNDRRRWSGAVI